MIKKIGATLDSIVNFIEYVNNISIVKLIKSLIAAAVFIITVAAACNYMSIIEWFQDTADEIIDTRHDELTKYRIKIGPEIENILHELCIEGDGTRAYILEFHNGTNNPAGLPFYYMNMTYEWTDIRKTYSGASEWTELLISRFPLVSKCFADGIYVGSVDDIQNSDPSLAYKLKAVDVNYIGCIILYGKNKPIGILGISTGEEPITSYDEIKVLLFKYSQRIIKLLDGFEKQ